MFRCRVTACVAILLLPVLSLAAPNIYPDPSFENTGVPGVARTGEKAGYLKVGARNHWAAIGGAVTVEPFARYRVTEWVKGKIGRGSFFAPYCYEWNSYEWAFSNSHTIQTCNDWTQTEMTFVSPYDRIQLHPLAYIECQDSEVWVDDIVVEKIAEPAQVMAEVEGRTDRSPADIQLLARWYIKQGKVDAAADLMKTTGDRLTLADLACIVAQATKDPAQRRPYIIQMLVNGGPTYNDGVKRFDEITAGLTDEQKLQVCEEAVDRASRPAAGDRASRPDNTGGTPVPPEVVARSYTRVLGSYVSTITGAEPMAEATAKLATARASVTRLSQAVSADSPAGKELQASMKSVDDADKALQERKASLGNCKIVIGGKTVSPDTHAIAIPDRSTPQEQQAARDLAYQLELVTGQSLPVVPERELGAATPILVGNCRLLRRLDRTVDVKSLGLEGIYIHAVGPTLILAGNQRGVLYATYQFLEENIGCRWFTPDCATWPKTGTIRVPDGYTKRYLPPLEYRAGDYPIGRPGDFAARCKFNGSGHNLDAAHGGKIDYVGFVHTFSGLVPPETYFATHPEYFSLINGKRMNGYAQLCLTNPDVLRIVTEEIRKRMRENPQATIFSISQNDTGYPCQCENCQAIVKREGSEAGPLIEFVNKVADAVKDEFPDKIIDTLAYQHTRKPPLHVRPRPNVCVRLCSIECCFIHPLATDPFNKTFVNDIKGWHKICNRLYIWDYVINYAHSICPFPNLYVLKPNINFFINNGVKGIYEESCYYTKGSELQELRNYIIGKTLWDPKYDTDKAIDEFCAAFYGDAAKPVREYINLIHRETQKKPKLHVAIYTHPKSYVTPEMIAGANKLFDEAEAAVKDDPVRLHRVQVARLPIMYAEITLATGGAFKQDGDKLVQQGGSDVSAIGDRFAQIAHAEGVTMIREGGPDANVDEWLKRIPRAAHEVKIQKLSNPAVEVSILPEMGGRIWRMQTADGHDLLKMNGKEGAWDPVDGGYEEYSEGAYRSAGYSEAYAVKEATPTSVTLEAKLRNGLVLTRKVALDAEKPLVKVTSTLTNPGGDPKTACLRVHPEFAVASTEKTVVGIQLPNGTWKPISLANPADPQGEKEIWLKDDDRPAGAWTIQEQLARTILVNRVPREQLGQCLLNWNGAQGRVNLELYSPEQRLGAGQSITIDQSYEVTPAGQM